MRWDYSVEKNPGGIALSAGEYSAYGIKIVKTLYDDSEQVVLVMDTTAEDAKENAEEGFLQEYLTTCQQIFSEQLSYMISLQADGKATVSSQTQGLALGRYLTNSLIGLTILTDSVV